MRALLALLLLLPATAGLEAQQRATPPRDTSAAGEKHVRGLGFASFGGGPTAPVAADGTFTLRDVPPGEYSLEASRYAAEADGVSEAAVMTVFVDGSDLEGLVLAGSNGGIVSGRVVSESGALPRTSEYLESLRRHSAGLTIPEDGSQTLTLRLVAPEK